MPSITALTCDGRHHAPFVRFNALLDATGYSRQCRLFACDLVNEAPMMNKRWTGLLLTAGEHEQLDRAVSLVQAQLRGDLTTEEAQESARLVGCWRGKWFMGLRERMLGLFLSDEEKRLVHYARVLLVGDIAAVEEEEHESLRSYDETLRRHEAEGAIVDLSATTAKMRADRGLPASGSVRGMPGVSDELALAYEIVEAYRGKVPILDATKVVALIDPDGAEARLMSYRATKAGVVR
jgi:hypothetical protein